MKLSSREIISPDGDSGIEVWVGSQPQPLTSERHWWPIAVAFVVGVAVGVVLQLPW